MSKNYYINFSSIELRRILVVSKKLFINYPRDLCKHTLGNKNLPTEIFQKISRFFFHFWIFIYLTHFNCFSSICVRDISTYLITNIYEIIFLNFMSPSILSSAVVLLLWWYFLVGVWSITTYSAVHDRQIFALKKIIRKRAHIKIIESSRFNFFFCEHLKKFKWGFPRTSIFIHKAKKSEKCILKKKV